MQLENYEGEALNELKAGRTLRVDDVGLRGGEPGYAAIADVGVQALLSLPLLVSGVLKVNLSIHQHEPRHWTDDEVALVQEVAERLWAEVVRARAEFAFRESEERLRQFGQASTDVLWIRNAETLQWEYLSAAFETIYGLSCDEALSGDNWKNWAHLIVEEDREHALEAIRRVGRGNRETFEYRIRRPADGQIRWLRNTDFPMRDAAGKLARIGGVGTDITALKAAEQHLQTLVAELQHRVRNTLAVVRSIARRTAENSTTAEDMFAHFQGRLDAFSRVQAALTRNSDAKVDLAALIEDELIAYAAHDGQQVRIEGPAVALDPKTAERLSLAIHELTTNAVKHGALTRETGRIAIKWRIESADGSRDLALSWIESGIELSSAKPQPDGFGMELLRQSLPYELQAQTDIELRPKGLRFELRMPLTTAQS